ncbi:MAG: hypothetical protein CMJ58_19250 [Planctomycetaceae bacterium]|nr:hypothetical protein [Planctomycetaceae bacterium]
MMRHRPLKLWLLAVAAALAGSTHAAEAPAEFKHFVTARDGQLFDGEQPLRFVSWNVPNLLAIEDSFSFLGESPWRWPNEFEISDALTSVQQMGGRVVRTYVITVKRAGADMGGHVHVLAPGEFNEQAFVALDRVLQIANRQGVRVILPLVDNWHWMGGVEQYAAFRGKEQAAFWTDPQLREDFKATIRYVVNRRNTLTGQLYRDDKAILGWETGNELDSPADWTADIAAYLQQLDPNHLVIDGNALHGLQSWSLADPNIDVVTTHHYPGPGRDAVADVKKAAAAARGKKPYFVGEVGFIPLADARRLFDTVIDEGVCGALYWSLRFHRREGGFYWHDEPQGENVFKAYHWPGFPSGDAYHERELIDAVVNAAWRIRGEQRPAPAPPGAARLLPIEHPGRISWQGAAGASGYDVQRSESKSGPWETIAVGVSDAAVQYRPLFCDETARADDANFYRVVSLGPGGAGPPSNVVGRVAIDKSLLVDELQDRSRLHATAGDVQFRHDQPRRVQEDIHRLQLPPGATVTYKLPGHVMGATAWLFAEESAPDVAISASPDGETYSPLTCETTTTSRSAGDYGYWQPFLLKCDPPGLGLRFVRIVNNGDAPVQLSRVEIFHRGAP